MGSVKAGSDLDELVAKRVMMTDEMCVKASFGGCEYRKPHRLHYSTDIREAWKVLERIWSLGCPDKNYWDSSLAIEFDKGCVNVGWRWHENFIFLGNSDSPSCAICIAAFKAVGFDHG